MKKTIFMLAAAAALFTFPSCQKVVGDGPMQTETRNITDFSGVMSSIGGIVNYRIDPVYKVEITAQGNILDVLETSKTDGHLLIKVRNGVRIKSNEDIVVNISAPTADYLHLSGSGDLNVSGIINSANIDMNISGSGNIFVSDVFAENNIKANISGSGGINIKNGTAKNEDLNISGSGYLTLDGVAAEKVNTRISGSGNLRIHASQTLDATISGSGSVFYLGNPVISANISGSGKVRPL